MRWILILCASLLLMGMLPGIARAQTPTPDPATIERDCAAILPADRPQPAGPDAPTIRIISPVSGTIIRSSAEKFADVTLTVEASNFTFGGSSANEDTRHWHIWLNNSVWGMAYQDTALVGIPFGRWRLCASLGDSDHTDIGQPDAIYLIVERAAPGEPDEVILPEDANTVPPETGGSTPVALIGALGILAAAGSWWLGRRFRPIQLND